MLLLQSFIPHKIKLDLFSKTTKVIKLDVPYFLRNSLYSGAQQGVGVIFGLTVSYLFGHYVSKQTYGEYTYILSVLGLLTFFSLPGIDTALIQSIATKHDGSYINAFNAKFKTSVIGSLVLLAIAIYYFITKHPVFGISLLSASVIYPFLFSFNIYSAFLTAKKRFGTLTVLTSLSSLLFTTFIAISIFLFGTPIGIFIGYCLGSTIPSLIGYLYSLKFVNNKKTDLHLNNYGSFLTFLSILPWISGNIGGIILGALLGTEALALFAVAGNFLTSVQKSFIFFYKPITAKLAEQTTKEHSSTLIHHSLAFILIGILLCLALWVTTPILIQFFFPTYFEAIYYTRLISLSLIPLPITWVLNDIVLYQKIKKPQIIASTVPHVLKILLYFFFIPQWKITGLIIVILIDRFFAPFIPLFFLVRNKRLK